MTVAFHFDHEPTDVRSCTNALFEWSAIVDPLQHRAPID
jgi:hypothetical protein